VTTAEREARRVIELARSPAGIPPTGAVTLLRNDPLTQGPKLFAKHCASCHRFDGHDGLGGQPKDPASAADLKGFAGRDWLAGLLDPERVATPHYFGATKFKAGKMVKYVKEDVAAFPAEDRRLLGKTIIALSAEAGLKSQRELDRRDATLIAQGREALVGTRMNCADCHVFHGKGETVGPDLTGYGSRSWLIEFIGNPAHPRFYGDRNDRMPLFGEDKVLTPGELGLLVDWLRGEWFDPAPVAAK
ncbi:MAG: c-type cytochrome, partial [Opitutaceae bacterium]